MWQSEREVKADSLIFQLGRLRIWWFQEENREPCENGLGLP